MSTPQDWVELLARCSELAKEGEWRQIDAICEKMVHASPELPELERARWMRNWACWILEERLHNGRDEGMAAALLAAALPLAKSAGDYHLAAKILVQQTHLSMGADVDTAARQFWSLLSKHRDLEVYRGHILYNLGYRYSLVGQWDRAARYYRQATEVLEGRFRGLAYDNLAEACIELGRYHAAEKALDKADPLIAPEDRPIYLSIRAYLALKKGYGQRALMLIAQALADHTCSPLARAFLGYYEALAYEQLGDFAQADITADQALEYAGPKGIAHVCSKLTLLRASLASRKGVR